MVPVMKSSRARIALLASALCLGACGGSGGGAPAASASADPPAASEPRYGGHFVLAFQRSRRPSTGCT